METFGGGLRIYMPPKKYAGPFPAVYYAGGMEKDYMEAVMRLAERDFPRGTAPFCLIAVPTEDWDADLAPWPAPNIWRGEPDFGSGAADYISRICSEIIPSAEAAYPLDPARRCIAGYSLAGLAAIYALYVSEAFCGAAGVSASLWYDGFTDYMRLHEPFRKDVRVYLSYGRKEPDTKNVRVAQIGERMREAHDILSGILLPDDLRLDVNNGGHGSDTEMRVCRALTFLMRR